MDGGGGIRKTKNKLSRRNRVQNDLEAKGIINLSGMEYNLAGCVCCVEEHDKEEAGKQTGLLYTGSCKYPKSMESCEKPCRVLQREKT